MNEYSFSNTWFDRTKGVWDVLLPKINPKRVLEIGSFEGASACYIVEKIGLFPGAELYCIDSWDGGEEHHSINMNSVQSIFQRNIAIAQSKAANPVKVEIRKGVSALQLAILLSEVGNGYFDLIYVDGSHQAPDVLYDAVVSFQLLRKGGLLIFDDYLWKQDSTKGANPTMSPKLAIDAFVNTYFQKVSLISAPLYQLYLTKLAD